MAKCGTNVKLANEGLGYVQYSRSFSRKRIVLWNDMEVDSSITTPTKKQCSENSFLNFEKSLLETLPQETLIRILCGVDHDDLKALFNVSKSIREATLIAKQWHFAYSTPTKRLTFRNSLDLVDSGEFDEVKAPNAPKQLRLPRSQLSRKKLANISVTLFASPANERWPRRELFMEMETEI